MLSTSKLRLVKGISSAATAATTTTPMHATRPAVATGRTPFSLSNPSLQSRVRTMSENSGIDSASADADRTNHFYRQEQHCRTMLSPSSHFHSQTSQQPHQRNQSVIALPEPSPVLLLTGDELHLTTEGISRSHYRLDVHRCGNKKIKRDAGMEAPTSWTIEEKYHLEESFKRFVMRERNIFGSTTSSAHIDIQEMDTRKVGTGGTTWEASLAMALYFAQHPKELQGNVIELGSGVGLGGILLHHVTHQQNSMVLTDGNDKVLEQCRVNIARRQNVLGQEKNDDCGTIRVQKIDWNDILREESPTPRSNIQQQYNTVLACDCAYLKDGVPALAATLKALLLKPPNANAESDKNNEHDHSGISNKIHLFGPVNRALYYHLIDILKKDENLEVESELLELCRYRLAAPSTNTNSGKTRKEESQSSIEDDATSVLQHPYNGNRPYDDDDTDHNRSLNQTLQQQQDELQGASKTTSKYLHVSASYRAPPSSGAETGSSLSDID